ncbi:MAG TPA: 30S ribosomal protein S1 [Candidatus Limnocylindrales bacterium]|nr:30S ribosomal protein S1 [Candidatus Limnocylindrales bacterium]
MTAEKTSETRPEAGAMDAQDQAAEGVGTAVVETTDPTGGETNGALDVTGASRGVDDRETAETASEEVDPPAPVAVSASAAPADDPAEPTVADSPTTLGAVDAPAVEEGPGEPAAEEPSAEEPSAEEPSAEEPSAEEPAGEEPSVDQPSAEGPSAEEPAPQPVSPSTDGPSAIAAATEPRRTRARASARAEPTTMEELLAEQDEDIRSFKHGDVVEGTIVRIDKDEILVDIGAKSEGVVSNRELYGRHAENPPVLNMGDTVLVYVLQPESPEGHAVLSLRRAGLERKWRSMQELFEAGTIIEAPVIDHNKGGLIVDCGIRGFVPISQIVDFPRRPQNEQPRDAAQEIAEKLQPYVGRKLRLKILEVNRKANRLILSEKVALYEERREKRDELFSSLQVGQKVTGTIRSIAPFGIFVDLGGIDGLVHKSELSWNKVNNPESGYRVGEDVEAEVIDINHERGRISLSIRRLQPDPWESTVADFNVGDLIDGTVTKIVNFGAFVRVRDGLEGLIHISELSHQRVAHPSDVVHEGQHLQLKIISLDSERHRLGLSLKQAEEPPAREARERRRPAEREYDSSQAVQEPEGGIDNTLAAAFAQVRQQMAETEAARSEVGETEAPPEPTTATVEEATEAPPEPTTATADEATEAPPEAGTATAEEATEAPPEPEVEPSAATAEVRPDDEPAASAAPDEAPPAAREDAPSADEAAMNEPTAEAGTSTDEPTATSASDVVGEEPAAAAEAGRARGEGEERGSPEP